MIQRITRDDTEHGELYCKSEGVEHLELENAEMKAKLAEYERKVKEGELVTVDVVEEWVDMAEDKTILPSLYIDGHQNVGLKSLKQFAAEKAKESKK